MTSDKIDEVLKEIHDSIPYARVRFPAEFGETPSETNALAHAKWMAFEALSAEEIGKKVRWLGFIQGILWATGRQHLAGGK